MATKIADEIDDGRVLRERPQLGVLIHGFPQPPDVRLLGAMIRRQVELVVGGGDAPRLLASILAATTARSRSRHAAPT
jgi:hypothetical protein